MTIQLMWLATGVAIGLTSVGLWKHNGDLLFTTVFCWVIFIIVAFLVEYIGK